MVTRVLIALFLPLVALALPAALILNNSKMALFVVFMAIRQFALNAAGFAPILLILFLLFGKSFFQFADLIPGLISLTAIPFIALLAFGKPGGLAFFFLIAGVTCTQLNQRLLGGWPQKRAVRYLAVASVILLFSLGGAILNMFWARHLSWL